MESFEEIYQKLRKEVRSRGSPAEVFIVDRTGAEVIGLLNLSCFLLSVKICLFSEYLNRRRNSFSGEVDLPLIEKTFQVLRSSFHIENQKVQSLAILLLQVRLRFTQVVNRKHEHLVVIL